jgi:hypothetical protein
MHWLLEATIWAEYRAKVAPTRAEYDAKVAPIWAEYRAKVAPTRAEYDAKVAPIWACATCDEVRAKFECPTLDESAASAQT